MNKLIFLSLFFLLISCDGEDNKKSTGTSTVQEVKAKFVGIKNNDQFILGNDLNIRVQLKNMEQLKNLEVYMDNEKKYEGKPSEDLHIVTVKTDSLKVGFVNLRLVAQYEGEEKPVGDTRKIVFFSNLIPKTSLAKSLNKYPHNPLSYTQGLEFDGEQLWEGTGQRGRSKILHVNLNSGKVLDSIDLQKNLFGEGITILNDKIYQLTWQAGRCLVYDKNSLQKINEMNYNGEGWGLANDGESLIMTDGSSKIVFRDPETFQIKKTIYAFDHSKEWNLLNEIEWVEGKIYANVYQRSDIIVINPKTGKVEEVIDCYDVDREMKLENPKSDVLNGIAYKKSTKELFITGKNYPYLAKIQVTNDLP